MTVMISRAARSGRTRGVRGRRAGAAWWARLAAIVLFSCLCVGAPGHSAGHAAAEAEAAVAVDQGARRSASALGAVEDHHHRGDRGHRGPDADDCAGCAATAGASVGLDPRGPGAFAIAWAPLGADVGFARRAPPTRNGHAWRGRAPPHPRA